MTDPTRIILPIQHGATDELRKADRRIRELKGQLADVKKALAKGNAEAIARLFHEHYERLAPGYDYETRPDSAKPWADVPSKNRALMIAVTANVLDHLRKNAKVKP